MGCGLDQTGRACDNGTCHIYNVDLPDIIAARNELTPSAERETNVAADLNDFAWMDAIDGSHGAVFFAAGVFYYFTTDRVKKLARELNQRFLQGRLVFDTVGKLGARMMRKTFGNDFAMDDYADCLYVENPAELEVWCDGAQVSTRGYMLGYNNMHGSGVSGFHRFLARCCDGFLKMRIVKFDFAG